MGVPGSANLLLLGGQQGYQISRSLRFNSADSAYLNRTFGTPTDNIKWTWSGWVKRSALGSYQNLFIGDDGSSNNFCYLRFSDVDKLECYQLAGGSYNLRLETNGVFRDPSAWYHVVLIYDSANATSTDRVQIYVNGTRQTVSYVVGPFSQNTACQANVSSRSHAIGRLLYANLHYLNGYLTEINFIDGQALTPSSFGETDTITGVWKPKKYAGTYGTNGFYLNFSDNSGTTSTTLGKDSSGNSNNWTPNNFSVTAGAGNDSMIDTPTPYADGGNGRGNYCILNPLVLIPRGTISNGNLNYISGSTASHGSAAGSFTLPTSGKWYWEVTACSNSGGSGNNEMIGVANIQNNPQLPAAGSEIGGGSRGDYGYRSDGNKYNNGSQGSYGATYTNGDVIGVAWSSDAGTLTFYKNGVSQGTAFSSITQVEGKFAPASSNAESSNGDTYNFGQRPFAYTPPSGFVALNTQNLPEPSIKKPGSYFDAKLYTGNNGTLTVTGLGFSPDLVWIKNREVAGAGHVLQDQVRGTTAYLQSNSTAAENTNTANNWFRAFTSDGFTVAATTTGGSATSEWNNNGSGYVAWCWDESATPGFDIVSFTATSTSMTVNHGLGVTPDLVILKRRDSTDNWFVNHSSFATRTGNYLVLNSTQAIASSATTFTGFSSTTVSFGSGLMVNTATYVAYLWSEVAGFSKFGSYTGNGSSDGVYIHLGFTPAVVIVKQTNSANDWVILDNRRDSFNSAYNSILFPNDSAAENSGANKYWDSLSNGIKIRGTSSAINGSGSTYVFCAWAETPAKFSLAR